MSEAEEKDMERIEEILKRRTVVDLLTEMKNLAQLSVDLAYAVLLFGSEELAEEVKRIESRIDELSLSLKAKLALAVRSVEDVRKLLPLMELAQSMEVITDAANDVAETVAMGAEPHPIVKEAIAKSEEKFKLVRVEEGSELDGRTLGELKLASKTGMHVVAIRRGRTWIVGPDKHTEIRAGDVLIVRGREEGFKRLKRMARGSPE
ncbi:MAG: potassium channel family protein [Methanopyraceae archaeon]